MWATWNADATQFVVVKPISTTTSSPTTGPTGGTDSGSQTSPPGSRPSDGTEGQGQGQGQEQSTASTGLSTAAKAGIGVGAGIGAILLAAVGYLWWRLHKTKGELDEIRGGRGAGQGQGETSIDQTWPAATYLHMPKDVVHDPQEADGRQQRVELPGQMMYREVQG